MNIFAILFHKLSKWFAKEEPAPPDVPISTLLFDMVDADVVHYLREHPEQVPSGVTLPPDVKFSFVKRSPLEDFEEAVSNVRFDLPDEPPAELMAQICAQVGPDEPKSDAGRRLESSFSRELIRQVNLHFAGQAPYVYRAAHLSRQAYSAIISDDKHQVARSTALALIFALRLNEDEAQWMLQKAGYSLSDALLGDMICKCCLRSGVWNLDIVNKLLEKYHCNTLP